MRRILRVGLVVASLAGLAGTLAPTPAHATTVGSVTLALGTATVHSHGIAYPLVGSETGDVDLNKNPFTNASGNSVPVHFEAATAIVVLTNVNKPGKLPAEAGTAVIVGDGMVHGYCDLSHGTLHGTMSVFPVTGGSQHFSFSLSWTAVVGNLVVTGTVHKHNTPQSGVLEGLLNAFPNPTAGSCTNKHQKDFLVSGEVAFELL